MLQWISKIDGKVWNWRIWIRLKNPRVIPLLVFRAGCGRMLRFHQPQVPTSLGCMFGTVYRNSETFTPYVWVAWAWEQWSFKPGSTEAAGLWHLEEHCSTAWFVRPVHLKIRSMEINFGHLKLSNMLLKSTDKSIVFDLSWRNWNMLSKYVRSSDDSLIKLCPIDKQIWRYPTSIAWC